MKYRNVLLLFFCAFIGVFLNYTEVEGATAKEKPLAVLYSASDFQNSEGHIQGKEELEKITGQIYDSGIKTLSEALICGDYYYDDEFSADESTKGIESVYSVLNDQWGLEHDEIFFVQGNHDPADTLGLDATGGADRNVYSVYQINHDDYMWSNKTGVDIETQILATAENLRGWLDAKIVSGDSKPVFVITHLPLHHSYRYDNPYSEYIFDVLNEAGEKGLNIVYLFGHNHSREYDNYLGGGAIYLTKGDEMLIPDVQGENVADYKLEVLNFTYMNAGYIGEAEDGILSSCIFEIFEDRIEVKRYTKDGIYDLKVSGVSSENDLGWEENLTVKQSPQSIDLNHGIVSWGESAENEKIFLDINEAIDLTIQLHNMQAYDVVWECSNTEIAEISIDKSNNLKAHITGKKYGTVQITVTVQELLDNSQTSVKLKKSVLVTPQNAVCISYEKNARFYGLVEDLRAELEISGGQEKEYIISNSDKTGSIKAFAAQSDEYVGTEDLQTIYVPGIGNVITANREKNVLWRFRKVEGTMDNVNEYQLQISPKSLYRYRYFVAVTSGIDSGLGYPNLTNMRTCSKDTSSGAAVFWFDDNSEVKNGLLTSYHYKDGLKENENGTFKLVYDDLNDQFVLSNQEQCEPVYYYGRVFNEVSDILMWTDASAGGAHVGDESMEQTGGSIYVMHEGIVEEIPVTLKMLSGFEENVPGNYMCNISFNGEILSENYELELQEENMGFFMFIKRFVAELFS